MIDLIQSACGYSKRSGAHAARFALAVRPKSSPSAIASFPGKRTEYRLRRTAGARAMPAATGRRGGERFPRLDLNPQQRKSRTLAALTRQLESLAQNLPILMIFEDLHWIDPTSREFLDLVFPRLISDRPAGRQRARELERSAVEVFGSPIETRQLATQVFLNKSWREDADSRDNAYDLVRWTR
jgi:hypothetical protein